LKVISVCLVISTSNISETVQDTSNFNNLWQAFAWRCLLAMPELLVYNHVNCNIIKIGNLVAGNTVRKNDVK